MKKVTYEEWQKNPKPRKMWVWDDYFSSRVKRKVIYLLNKTEYPVVVVLGDEQRTQKWKHCAEIEEPKTRRMTNKELSWWLSEKPHRERKFAGTNVYSYYVYVENEQDEEVPEDIRIRENGGEWREPLVEVEE